MSFCTNFRKSPVGVLSPKKPPGDVNQIFHGQQYQFYINNTASTFRKIVRKSNRYMKSYGIKSLVLNKSKTKWSPDMHNQI